MQDLGLRSRLSVGCAVQGLANGFRLRLAPGPAGRYRVAQLDDYWSLPRRRYRWRPGATLTLRARVSSATTPGTWGFGFWNDPFGLGVGSGVGLLRMPAMPQAAWFFHASPRSYLSFRDDKPANGFLAQTFSSSRSAVGLLPAAVMFPFSRRRARQRLRRIIGEDSVAIDLEPGKWHQYCITCGADVTRFEVDDQPIFQTVTSPRKPLGLVLWIDNQYAAFDPRGQLSWGTEASLDECWLEIEDIQCDA